MHDKITVTMKLGPKDSQTVFTGKYEVQVQIVADNILTDGILDNLDFFKKVVKNAVTQKVLEDFIEYLMNASQGFASLDQKLRVYVTPLAKKDQLVLILHPEVLSKLIMDDKYKQLVDQLAKI